ncbi:UDP-N-acetylglucosamine 2-epimerase [Aciduliprofundum sp. MAR08-339]|uniref:non-hydrolyzing UDP-N-acetylglucosamine 2-epimerase n=1 Tax=Aciduliprofundum sp. (strain MAR08-339) TaxID=673860 RepID=UPI0002A4C77C|nr:UDP-N-acetylglucosamine 2-epimerase [Aciduliprofundum sp. MAR08-339]
MKIGIILGTRPEIIKMSPIIRELEKRNIEYSIIHTGQHYSYNMDRVFFEDLELPEPEYKLNVGEKYHTHGSQTGEMIKEIEKILVREDVNIVLVEGDTNSVLAGGISASKLHIPVGHVEAGLRSFDRRMPEEINRIIVDHLSDLLFAPTEVAKSNLIKEGIPDNRIFVTGNTIVDAVYQNLEIAKKRSNILNVLGLKEREYVIVTVHREENVDKKENLIKIVKILNEIHYPSIFPMHPRTKKRLEEYGLTIKNPYLRVIEPLGYLDFLLLLSKAKIVLTDSGGIQEEANILHIPCLTLRDNTERPETVKVGSNIVVGREIYKILNIIIEIFNGEKYDYMRETPIIFGDGKSGKVIVDILESWRG